MPDPGGQQAPNPGAGPPPPSPAVVQQTTVIQVGSQKSVAGAVLLALFFGPIGMVYSTVPGALVMFVVSLIVVIPTLGLGLLVTLPAGALWAGIAASNHNKGLGTVSSQAVAPVPAPAQPVAQTASSPAWHEDPDGSGRLRYWDGSSWTDRYTDRPGAGEPAEQPPSPPAVEDGGGAQLDAGEAPPGIVTPVSAGDAAEAPTATPEAEAQHVFCEACGKQMAAADRFCPACGEPQATG